MTSSDTATPPSTGLMDRLVEERTELQALLPRTDAKAQALLAPHSVLLGIAMVIVRIGGVAPVAMVSVWAAAVCAVGAMTCSVLVIAPRQRRGRVRRGVTAPAQTPDELLAELLAEDDADQRRELAAHVIELRRIARAKFLLLGLGCTLLLGSVALIALAAATA